MHSMHVIGSRRFGGAERFYVRLTAALARRGESVLCVLPPHSELRAELNGGVGQRPIAMRSVFDIFARARIGSCARAFGADIIQTYMGRATRLAHFPRRKGLPVHVARLGGYYDPKGYKHAHAWVVNAHGIRDYLIDEGFDPRRVFYIGNFVEPCRRTSVEELSELRSRLDLEPDALLLVCLGRLHHNKGFDVMLDALARLPQSIDGRPLRLIMVGDGPQRDALMEQAGALGVRSRSRWVGWCNEPAPYLQLADLFVCPSRHEPLGNVVLEAWSAGVPVLASDTGGLAELICHGDNGALVPPQDADALAEAIQTLLHADAAARDAYVQSGLQTLECEHAEGRVVDAYLAMYRKLVGQR